MLIFKNKQIFTLFTLLIFSFAWKTFVILNSPITFYSDDAIYAQMAKFFLERDFLHAFHPTWPPLFPFISSILYPFIQNWEITLRIVSAISAMFIIIPLYFLASKTINKIHALIFTISLLFFAPVFSASITPLSDMLATLLVVSCITSVFLGLQENNRRLFLLGAFFAGLTFLTRAEGTMFFGLSLIYLLIYFVFRILRRKSSVKYSLVTILLFICIFFLTVSPYVIATRIQLNRWTLSQKFSAQIQQEHVFKIRESGTTWAQEITSVKSPDYQSAFFRNGTSYLSKNIFWLLELFVQKAENWKRVLLYNFPVWSMPLIVLGILSGFKKYPFSNFYIAFLLILAVPITIFSTAIWDIRYLLWTIPLFMYFFYYGIYSSIRFAMLLFSPRKPRFFLLFAIPVFFLLILPQISFAPLFHPLSYAKKYTEKNYKPEIIAVSNWIIQNSKNTHPRIMMRHENIEFYTNGEIVYLPQDLNLDQLIAYARKFNTDYVVIWDEEISLNEDTAKLMKINYKRDGVKQAFFFPQVAPEIFIYEVEK